MLETMERIDDQSLGKKPLAPLTPKTALNIIHLRSVSLAQVQRLNKLWQQVKD